MQEGIWISVVRCGPVAQCNPIHHMSGTKVVAVISIETVEHPLYNPDPAARLLLIWPTEETLGMSMIPQ
jgi:hypothetical protein